jgi:predicted RNase H-like HicB family nuclease
VPAHSGGTQGTPGQPIILEVKVRLQAIALPEAEGGYSIVVPALPGCVTEADSIEEAQANVVEAAEGWLDVAHDRNREERTRNMQE